MPNPKGASPIYFATSLEFRSWLARNHAAAEELWVGFYKKSASKKGITYLEALDEALCYGWIDGVRYSVDSESYTNRFSPRTGKSVWSLVNVRHVERLKNCGKMAEPGLKAFEARQRHRTGVYSFEQKRTGLSEKYKKLFRANKKAWEFFSSQARWYQRTAGHWVVSAKQQETRLRRLDKLIRDSAASRRIDQLTPKSKRKPRR